MRGGGGALLALIAVFAPLSLLSVGGSNAVMADIAHQAVAVRHWTGEREFADLFALSRAAPGPGSMLAALIGWRVGGLAGAFAATVAFYLPSSLLIFAAAKLWNRWRGSRWHRAVERGLAPIAAGLLVSGGIAVLRAAGAGVPAWLLAAAATALFLWRPKLHPIAVFLGAGALFGLVALLGGSP